MLCFFSCLVDPPCICVLYFESHQATVKPTLSDSLVLELFFEDAPYFMP